MSLGGVSSRLAARLATAVLLAAGVCACGASGLRSPSATQAFDTAVRHVTSGAVQQEVRSLYREHPAISSFAVADVQYAASTLADVLPDCLGTSAGPAPETTQSQQLIACAPLIFFYYSYGREAGVPDSITLAHDLYSYAVTSIAGPLSAQRILDQLLRGWGLPVTAKPGG